MDTRNHWIGVGMAYAPNAVRINAADPTLLDFIEVPYEVLIRRPKTLDEVGSKPLVLHCASLSVGGALPIDRAILEDVRRWLGRLNSPWLSEHLAYVTAPGFRDDGTLDFEQVTNVGFTIPPPMNAEAVSMVSERLMALRADLQTEILIENSPLYFSTPGTTLSQLDFITNILDRAPVNLLLDLTHLVISARNCGFSAAEFIAALPIGRVAQLHLSGLEVVEDIAWDNHASPIPDAVLSLVPHVLARNSIRAVTVEYNWISDFSDDAVLEQLHTVKKLVTGG